MDNELLRKRVRQSGLTQAGLAEKAGVSRTTVQNIMSGRNRPRYEVILLLSEALELSGKDFLAIFFKTITFSMKEDQPIRI